LFNDYTLQAKGANVGGKTEAAVHSLTATILTETWLVSALKELSVMDSTVQVDSTTTQLKLTSFFMNYELLVMMQWQI